MRQSTTDTVRRQLEAAALGPLLLGKWDRLCALLERYGSVVVAYSGGVDSALLAYAAHTVLGDRMLAVTIESPLESEEARQNALAVAQEAGFPHRVLPMAMLENPKIRDNSPERCYHCKKAILAALQTIAGEEGFAVIVEGQNVDDARVYRPGRRAVIDCGAKSPLVESNLGKLEIRALAQALLLTVWNRPSAPCLATRFPYWTELSAEALMRVAKAESYLHALGLATVRVRVDGGAARIEVPVTQMELILAHRKDVVQYLSELHFDYVTLDLAGYRSGSRDEGLGK